MPDDDKELKKGDVDQDGFVTSDDALCILKYVGGITELDEKAKELADVDGAAGITTDDALFVLKYVVGLIDGFTPEDFHKAWEKQMEQDTLQ